ncbi:hypothetical protein [Chryseolinea lacunae]|uniref:DUF3575 domain-containing protein n=1 Tax=Chryseolinea lacunae TaxID=2801331 RepID=A0ABS1L2F2_9BACT|nr:hypothetical protein [Chryseolinea lacunae]MBL0744726.1 hypothetical protein [Chryseolinea lacunae]
MKTHRAACLLIFMLGVFQNTFAQSGRIEAPRFAVKWSPAHLVYFFPSLQVAAEVKVWKNVTVQYDAGWVFNFRNYDSDDYSNRQGFRGIGEVRYYLPQSPSKIPFYLAGEFYYARITFDRSKVAGFGCSSGDCDYFQYVQYRVVHHNEGGGLKVGILLFPGWNYNQKFFFDLNLGVAYRNITYTDVGLPVGEGDVKYFSNDTDHLFAPRENDRAEFRPVIGLRVGYRVF